MTAKEIVYSIIAFFILIIIGFHSIKYWQKSDAEIEMSKEQNRRTAENDSIKTSIAIIQSQLDSLKIQRENEKESRTNYGINKKVRDREILQATVDVNRQSNDNFILNFEPKYK